MSLLLKNCRLVSENGLKHILIENGIITAVSDESLEADSVMDVKGKYVLPGLIDCHVHFREPGMDYKEDWLTGSRAAVSGGVTTVLDMPNTKPATLTRKLLDEKKKLAQKSVVNYGFHFGSSKNNIDEIKKAEGIASVKVYMDHTTGDLLIEDDEVLEKIFMAAKVITVHAEGDNVKKAVELAKKHSVRLYLCHVSKKKEIEYLKKNKTENIFVEVTPHHLFLTSKDAEALGWLAKMKPELGTEEDRAALWEALKEGLVDTIGTDHAPHSAKEKEGCYGVPGVETMLPLLLNAVNEGKITLAKVVELTSVNPAKIFAIKNKGRIEEGYDADLVIVDMELKKNVDNAELFTKCRWSPFNGKTLKGWPVMTIVNSEIVYNKNNKNKIKDVKAKGVEYYEF